MKFADGFHQYYIPQIAARKPTAIIWLKLSHINLYPKISRQNRLIRPISRPAVLGRRVGTPVKGVLVA
jgi:hypothetical protein